VNLLPLNLEGRDDDKPVETEGRNYTPAEYVVWLEEAGFRAVETEWFDAPGASGAVIGRKP